MKSKFIIKYAEDFGEDLKIAIDWYDTISIGLGTKFLNQIWLAEHKVFLNPFAFYRTAKSGFRRIILLNFPYKIYFRIDNNTIFFIALIHISRSNKYVGKRLKGFN